jgi:deoxyribodipyrimidine photo-lyase
MKSAFSIEVLKQDPRVTVRRDGTPDPDGSCVVYCMQRSQRALDNPALDTAVAAANLLGKPVVVFLPLMPFHPNPNLRQLAFFRQGIVDIANGLERRRIGFVLRRHPDHHLVKFCDEVRAALVVGDENPLREPESWRRRVARQLRVPFWTVDSDVVVPTKLMLKEQFAARTIRPRIKAHLDEFLVPCLNLSARIPWKTGGVDSLPSDFDITQGRTLDRSVQPVATLTGGTKNGLTLLRQFVRERLPGYSERRNHPELEGTSKLSPYLHFGHLGPHTVALAVRKAKVPLAEREAFLEQLIVRRELAINFVRFNANYDAIECMEPWADRSFAQHCGDPRPVTYRERQFENAETHDPLWNAAQRQMVTTGWMHNYMRMYWAKKILEWSPSVAAAFHTALRLNDRYQLDGRDPNGYAGVAWAILGKHDRAWPERPIFGKVRYMSFASTSRKFDSKRYIEQVSALGA